MFLDLVSEHSDGSGSSPYSFKKLKGAASVVNCAKAVAIGIRIRFGWNPALRAKPVDDAGIRQCFEKGHKQLYSGVINVGVFQRPGFIFVDSIKVFYRNFRIVAYLSAGAKISSVKFTHRVDRIKVVANNLVQGLIGAGMRIRCGDLNIKKRWGAKPPLVYPFPRLNETSSSSVLVRPLKPPLPRPI